MIRTATGGSHTRALLGCAGRKSEFEAPVSDRVGTSSSPRSHDKALRARNDRRAPTDCCFRLLAALSAGTAELLRAQQRLIRAVHRGSDVPTGIIGWRRAWTVSMISALSMPCRYTDVMPRLLWPAGAG